jgi:hypothetical protein
MIPWSIDNYWDKKISRIYKVNVNAKKNATWTFVKELPLLHSDTEAKLLKRIQNLIPFL